MAQVAAMPSDCQRRSRRTCRSHVALKTSVQVERLQATALRSHESSCKFPMLRRLVRCEHPIPSHRQLTTTTSSHPLLLMATAAPAPQLTASCQALSWKGSLHATLRPSVICAACSFLECCRSLQAAAVAGCNMGAWISRAAPCPESHTEGADCGTCLYRHLARHTRQAASTQHLLAHQQSQVLDPPSSPPDYWGLVSVHTLDFK